MTATLTPPETAARAGEPAATRPAWFRAIAVFASMKLTVVLLLFFGVLTFAGTLAQKDLGLFVAQRDFFESFWVVWDTGIGLPFDRVLKVPLPGGYLLLLVLFTNIMVGGVVRLRWRWRNAGILVTHLGMALLLVAGWVKLHFSYAGFVSLFEGRQTASMVSGHDFELALLRRDGDRIQERVVPAADLAGARQGVVTIADAALPFTIEVSHWLDNCRPAPKGPMFDVGVPVVDDGQGGGLYLEARALEKMQEHNQAGCYATVRPRAGGETPRGMLWGLDTRPYEERRFPFTFEVGGQEWGLDLRRVTWDLPFRVRLDRFQKTDHPGTLNPRDFSSWVSVIEDNGEQPVHIYMNHPLRRDGLVFFQTDWGPKLLAGSPPPSRWFSVFEVARNPSDAWPKYASYVILLGLVIHFAGKLLRYLRSSQYRAAAPEMS